jgi:hypothetical protein
MRQLFEAALEVMRKGEMVALATIVRAQGSTPLRTYRLGDWRRDAGRDCREHHRSNHCGDAGM